jgi:O-antigen ligase
MQSGLRADMAPARQAWTRPALPRLDRLPLAITLILAVLLAVAVSGQMAVLTFPVKLAVICVVGAAAAALFFSRPVLFPLCGYIFIVPFDTLLQTGGGTITKFLGLGSAVALVLVLTDRRRVIGAPMVTGLWALYLAWNVASYMWSDVPMYRNELITANIQEFVLFAIAAMVRIREGELRMLLATTLAGATSFALFGIWIFLHAPKSISGAGGGRLSIQMTANSYVNADHFSAALIMPIALAIVAVLHTQGWRKTLFGGLLLIMFAGAFVSGTRGSFIAIAAMGVYLLIVLPRQRLQLGAVAVVGLLASIPFPNVWMRFFDPGQGEAGGRYGIWGIAWAAFKQRPWFGYGVDNFRIAYSQFYISSAHGLNIIPWMQDAHNVIVSSVVELGLIGLVLTLVGWFFQYRIMSMIPRSSKLFNVRVAIETGTVGLFVNALAVDLMFYKYLWVAFTLGAFVRSAYLNQKQPTI